MGKNKDKGKAGGSKKSGRVRVPKKIRKLGAKAMDLAHEPVVADIVAAALLSAAAALRDGKDVRRAARAAGVAGAEAATAAGEAAKEAGKVGDSLRKLAIDLARRTLDSWDASGEDPKPSKPPKPPKPPKTAKPPKPPKPARSGARKETGKGK
jgi:hypothetical protein